MKNSQHKLPAKYIVSVPSLPSDYIDLIHHHFNLNKTDRVIDLGCGVGTLTLALAEYSSCVEGLDISQEMISVARKLDSKENVKWVCQSVEGYDFGINRYKLIISLESFHLFESPEDLLHKIIMGLVLGGSFCIGWINYGWEDLLKQKIITISGKYGISWDDWGYWSFPNFAQLAKKSGFSSVEHDFIEVERNASTDKIAEYLVVLSLNSETI